MLPLHNYSFASWGSNPWANVFLGGVPSSVGKLHWAHSSGFKRHLRHEGFVWEVISLGNRLDPADRYRNKLTKPYFFSRSPEVGLSNICKWKFNTATTTKAGGDPPPKSPNWWRIVAVLIRNRDSNRRLLIEFWEYLTPSSSKAFLLCCTYFGLKGYAHERWL